MYTMFFLSPNKRVNINVHLEYLENYTLTFPLPDRPKPFPLLFYFV